MNVFLILLLCLALGLPDAWSSRRDDKTGDGYSHRRDHHPIDQTDEGSKPPISGSGPHDQLSWNGSSETCLPCHQSEAREVHSSTHYQWQGDALYMNHGPDKQGKIAGAVNSYCINILGNWNACGTCHIGLGAKPTATNSPTNAQLANIDCLVCHQKEYKRTKVDGVFVPDTATMTVDLDTAVRTVHLPERSNCLQCHAKAGGGDAVKRGDLALAQTNTTDRNYDVHMSINGANLNCRDCHAVEKHRVAGKGSDIRPTDLDVQISCTQCHTEKEGTNGHETRAVNRHVARVACQTCHIPHYAKNAADTAASEATEIHRTWLDSHSSAPPYHPASTKANNRVPKYRFWNRFSDNYLLGDTAEVDPATGAYPTSRPEGTADDLAPDNKLYPFKYKTAKQPIMDRTGQLIALDTRVFFSNPDPVAATKAGLENMGFSANEPVSWITTDTLQLLNHQISPATKALQCNDCHGNTKRIDLVGELGYELKGSPASVCSQCHEPEDEDESFQSLHAEHVREEGYDCSNCHNFSRPERNLKMARAD